MDVAAFLLALVPIIWLVVMLLCFKWPAWKAAIGSFVLSCVLAFAWWHLPVAQIATASLEGFLMALWPIVLVIIAAVFTYNLCVRTGAMDVIGSMITSISSDRRLLALLVAWCFGGFMEGMAGFGTAVAIPAGMLAGLGFEAVPAVLICLLANGVPTPYGSIGIPTVSVADLVGLDSLHLATVQLVQLAPFFVVMPLLIVLVAGRVTDDQGDVASVGERLHGVAGIALLSGASFVGAALVVAMFVGPELAVVVGSIVSLALTAALAMRAEKSGHLDARFHMNIEAGEQLTAKSALSAWSCFILIFVLLLGTSNLVPAVHAALAPFASHVQVYCGENPGTLTFSWINTPGVWIFLAAFIGGAIQGGFAAHDGRGAGRDCEADDADGNHDAFGAGLCQGDGLCGHDLFDQCVLHCRRRWSVPDSGPVDRCRRCVRDRFGHIVGHAVWSHSEPGRFGAGCERLLDGCVERPGCRRR